MRIVILDAKTLGEDLDLTVFEKVGQVTVYDVTAQDQIVERIADAEVVVVNKARLTRENLAGAVMLKMIAITATGYDNIEVAYCRERGIAVCNVAGYSTDSVAQITVATVLSLASHLKEYSRYISSGEYSHGASFNRLTPVYHELSGMTWGIIGYGNIGRRVAHIAEALGCRVKAFTRTPRDGVDVVSLEELCKTSDIITLHVPLNEHTRSLIGAREIEMMRPGCVLVNEARGAVLDEAAVAEAVKAGHILFGCDVYSKEPFGTDHPYYQIKDLDSVCLTPHMAWGAHEARARCLDEIVLNIRAFEQGERRNRVD